MKYFVVFFFLVLSVPAFAQVKKPSQKVDGVIISNTTREPLSSVNIININKVRGATTDSRGHFEIDVQLNDTLHITSLGFQSLRVRVTNDWIKNKSTKIQLTEKAIALEEIVIRPFNLTGYLEVDTKIIPISENYRYSISGLTQGYEAGEYSPNAFGRVLGSIFNPADMLYNFFGNNPKELKKLKELKKDDTVRNLLESKFDRETIAVLLGIDKNEIPEILQRCNYSESFIKTANDLQIMDAISGCYEEYKVLKIK
ncbi:carboxypeptidase-like regulatory domain-containing protein [Flavobacterium sp. GSP27]|uniref:carboxypeptidase-like regulatory domain-containing protein n=1 Tax=unclassified Flavobacterium TaxID=196869 RepID=UPI000F831F5B|nr:MULTISPECIES: carboxypeptidase-like regulatory domain-containing protein [unclassified Flavobacterium]RTY94297.1 carboxypeptidase-like regulatory domain-containing protein [Flavobacterium sp. GSN2]RTY65253.1 carboxypeptidase-like regulatory domain-containing protein [Flavobacterium sp. LB2P53]RTY74124.1 carboxypeptidase-like regulatory domain-containing protein [Flavobacterium sp. LS1R10]RTY83596.1 carboxypeptidase-like regulatory domain-containing protein [Flavobacterium sp. LS1P28]RTY8361